ncbi:phosphotransferase [Planctomicrobium piriforme]|uniref:Ser/Thr protein kinase RdoA involved in Cpx stress response, MazF antagonist n=1 Tax=Planctomicrobium piriforme TaxID=1576369 RepID=A0A1I3FVX7_9PLAN|nr:phosphotransferase [Planctomicrobium piriforme]SFI15376.1 Ser/Thr protein kinase RdoA involved in Cpx stress response, MazF antagonist [Planctomicrobium piriforme]
MQVSRSDRWLQIARRFLPTGTVCESTRLSTGGFSGAEVVEVRTNDGRYALRGVPVQSAQPAAILQRHEWLRFLAEQGLPVAVPLRDALSGNTLIAFDNSVWQMEPWLPGTSVGGNELTPAQLTSMLHTLARLHLCSADFRPAAADSAFCSRRGVSPAIVERRARIRDWTTERLVLAADALAHAPAEFRVVASQILAGYFLRSIVIDEELRQLESVTFPLAPCWRDLWKSHVLFTGDQVTGLIDPHAAQVDNVATDLSRLLGSLFGDDFAKWKSALDLYEELRPLSLEEHRLLRVLDRSGVLLSGMTWLTRWREGTIPAEQMKDVVERLEVFAGRLSAI